MEELHLLVGTGQVCTRSTCSVARRCWCLSQRSGGSISIHSSHCKHMFVWQQNLFRMYPTLVYFDHRHSSSHGVVFWNVLRKWSNSTGLWTMTMEMIKFYKNFSLHKDTLYQSTFSCLSWLVHIFANNSRNSALNKFNSYLPWMIAKKTHATIRNRTGIQVLAAILLFTGKHNSTHGRLGKGKVAHEPRRPPRAELYLVSVAWIILVFNNFCIDGDLWINLLFATESIATSP